MYFSYVPSIIFSFFNRPLFLNLLFKQILIQYYSFVSLGAALDANRARVQAMREQKEATKKAAAAAKASSLAAIREEAKGAAGDTAPRRPQLRTGVFSNFYSNFWLLVILDFWQTVRGSFSAVSKPNFVNK